MTDTYHFHRTIHGRLDENGRFVPLSKWERVRRWLDSLFRRPRPRCRVTAVNAANGTITMERRM